MDTSIILYLQGYNDMTMRENLETLEEIIHRDPLSEVSEQEKELLWKMR